MDRIAQAAPTSPPSQADEFLRRATVADVSPVPADTDRRFIAERAGRNILAALDALPEYKPRPGINLGRLRVTVTVIDGPDLGSVDIDPVNLGDLADIAARRAEGLRAKHARLSRPHLRVVGDAS